MHWINEKENLKRLIIEENKSYEEIGRMYGCTGSNIKKAAKRLGLQLKQKRKINEIENFSHKRVINKKRCLECGKKIDNRRKWCSNKCMKEYMYKEYINKWKIGEEDGSKGIYGISNYVRRFIFEKYNFQCAECGWNKINKYTKKSTLQIHHIDGDPLNNSENNLILLCPNCHSLTNNFMSLNKGNKNTKLRSYYYDRRRER